MELERNQATRWEGYVNWRNKPALRDRHGGMLAASFVLVAEIVESLAYLANASNLVLYLNQHMHMSLSKSANDVTNFMGTAFFLGLLGGFLSDALFTTYHIFLISALIELLGLIVLTVQARSPSLQPPTCDSATTLCHEVSGGKAAMLYAGLYLVALGVGGCKGSLPSHGAEQLDENTPSGRKQRSTFFNYFVFCLSTGALIAVTFVVWVEDNKGWEWGFGISTISISLSILIFLAGSTTYRNKIPSGSPLTTILKVMVAASLNSFKGNSSSVMVEETVRETKEIEAPTNTLIFLNKAIENNNSSMKCTVEQVEDVKIVLKALPIFGCTIMLNCCLAQLSTFSIEQAATMNTKLGSFAVPPASLPVFPLIFILILAPIYDHVIIPFVRKVTKTEMGITHLQRIGIGLVLSIFSMAVAAIVEVKRKNVAIHSGLLDDATKPLPITFFWIALQYLFLGSADLFTFAGMLEFFFTEAPIRMRSLASSLSWVSLAIGYYLSSAIVSIVNSVTSIGSHKPWLSGANLNHYRLERFYWLMCGLSVLNFLHYLFWAIKYKYRGKGTTIE
ncbi:protein NRT1/ PTR FAMILY 4.6-like [Cajanus cajan]|uniref:protein NRT1/ PTR FAMILY 4.6-like n=1 Tax=Cajanus cajan TaxID=3821 RepID=UPI00098D84C0|nr:protein NRT1/ PTR FAMILY 4.6-like [Cajanus cajan]